MNIYIKPTITLGLIFGIFLGILSLIPVINLFSLLIFGLIGAGVVVYMKQTSLIGIINVNDGAIIGALSGFVSMITAAIIYLPIYFILGSLFENYHTIGFNMSTSFLVNSFNIAVMAMLVFFLALMNALFNAFSAVIATYIYEHIDERNKEEIPEFTIEFDQD